ncbi:MAG TPA: Na+/H+ antiporter NhaC family protein, partial [Thermodesulfobacteriota bacterium]
MGTIGIGLVGVALSMGLDPAITAGAVISGAYLGDTSSPLSDSADLAAGAEVDAIAKSFHMSPLVIAAPAFGGVIEKAGVLDRLITPIVGLVKSVGALVAALVATVFATNVATADQYIAIVLPGRRGRPRSGLPSSSGPSRAGAGCSHRASSRCSP